MNILDYAIVLTAFSTVDPMISQIEETIEEYVKDLHTINTAILSDGTYPWSQIRLSFPVLQRSLSLQTRLLTPISSLVIDFRNFTGHPMEPLQHLPNNTKKFIFLVDYENLKSIIKGMEDYEACNMLFLTINGTKLDKVKIKEPCKGIGAMPRNSRTKCVVNASVLSFPPATFYRSSTDIFGYEGLLFKTSAESLGLTVNYLNRSEKIGQADPPSAGALGDVVQKQSIATFGQLYSFQKRFWYLDLIQMCVDVDFSWAVPNQAGKAHPTWFIILVTEFSLTVWICLLLIYLTLVVTYFLMKDENMGTWSLGVFAVILGVPQSFEKNRAIMILVIIFGFTVTAHYKTMMSSKLTVPSPIPEIETNQELIDAGYRLLGIPSIGQIYRDISDGNPGDLVREEIANRYEPSVVDLKDHIFRIATMRDMAVTRSMDNIYYLSKLNNQTSGHIHVLKEPMLRFAPTTYLTKHGCLNAELNQQYNRVCESGLVRKWYKDAAVFHKATPYNGPRKLDLAHIKGFLFLWGAGCFSSFLTFILEIVVNYSHGNVKNRNSRQFQQFKKPKKLYI